MSTNNPVAWSLSAADPAEPPSVPPSARTRPTTDNGQPMLMRSYSTPNGRVYITRPPPTTNNTGQPMPMGSRDTSWWRRFFSSSSSTRKGGRKPRKTRKGKKSTRNRTSRRVKY